MLWNAGQVAETWICQALHNICFCGEIRKLFKRIFLSGNMVMSADSKIPVFNLTIALCN